MSKLSICIPVPQGAGDPLRLVRDLLAGCPSTVDILVACAGKAPVSSEALQELAASDPRLTILETEPQITLQALWRRAVEATTGDWVTLINPGDAIDTELVTMVTYLDNTAPSVDALAWNVFQIDPTVIPGQAASIAIPAAYGIDRFEKTAMLKSFFYWDGSLQSPKMPFGLHHAAIRRSLVDAILQIPLSERWTTPVPHIEWAAKTLLFAEDIAFCSRPMSAINLIPFKPLAEWRSASGFPFHAGLGLTGAVAETQFHVLDELGTPWGGNEDFVRACMIDCMSETDQTAFRSKGNAYFAALQQFEGGHLAGFFRPEFLGVRTPDTRRGLHQGALLVDRFLGGARTAPEFFHIARSMMAPVDLICGGIAVDGSKKKRSA